jgi:hypothetical protein
VGVAPLPARALALLDDRVDRTLCGCEIGDRDELLPPEVLLGRLGVRRSDEQALRAKPIGQVLQACLDRPVELADRVELLQMRDDLVLLVVGQRDGLPDRLEPSASSMSIPSGRSRKAKWRSADSPKGSSSIRTPAG